MFFLGYVARMTTKKSVKTKPLNPYQRLFNACNKSWTEAILRRTILLGTLNKTKLQAVDLTEIVGQFRAADALGYEILLRVEANELAFYYRQKLPPRPAELQCNE